ncbi:hypothetical protein CDIK_3825, partial [Cucumispora dikerogammari]
MNKMQFSKTKRGKQIISLNSHEYTHHSKKENISRWRCKNRKCTGALIIDETNEQISEKIHNHPPNHNSIEKTKIIEQIKKRATTTTERPIDIITKHTKNVKEDIIKTIPNFSYLRDTITRRRNITGGYSINKLDDVPECLKINLQVEKFLQYDTGLED